MIKTICEKSITKILLGILVSSSLVSCKESSFSFTDSSSGSSSINQAPAPVISLDGDSFTDNTKSEFDIYPTAAEGQTLRYVLTKTAPLSCKDGIVFDPKVINYIRLSGAGVFRIISCGASGVASRERVLIYSFCANMSGGGCSSNGTGSGSGSGSGSSAHVPHRVPVIENSSTEIAMFGAFKQDFQVEIKYPSTTLPSDLRIRYVLQNINEADVALDCTSTDSQIKNYTLLQKISISGVSKKIATISCNAQNMASQKAVDMYLFDNTAPAGLVSFSTPSTNFGSSFNLSLSHADPMAIVRFKMGSAPTSCTDGTKYETPISISQTTTVHAIACDAIGNKSASSSQNYTLNTSQATLASPSISPAGRGFNAPVSVSILPPPGTINNTTIVGIPATDPLMPVISSLNQDQVFNSDVTSVAIRWNPVAGATGYLFRAIEYVDSSKTTQTTRRFAGNTNANSSFYVYVDNPNGVSNSYYAKESVSLPVEKGRHYVFWVHAWINGNYKLNNTANFSISSTPIISDLALRYALDGAALSDCTQGSAYSSPISVSSRSTIVKAIACNSKGEKSVVVQESFTYDNVAPATPIIGTGSLTFRNAFNVNISSESGSVVRYSLDGVSPTNCSEGTLYAGAISISGSTKELRAIACDTAGNKSAVASASYLYDVTPPALKVTAPIYGSTVTDSFQLAGDCETGLEVRIIYGTRNEVTACNSSRFAYGISISNLVDGANEFKISQMDTAGNLTQKIHAVLKGKIIRTFAEAQGKLQVCISCHAPGKSMSRANLSFASEDEAFNSPYFKRGDLNSFGLTRTKFHRNSDGTPGALANMPPSSAGAWTEADYLVLKEWVMNAPPSTGGGGTVTPCNNSDSDNIPTSDNLRLTKTQLINSLKALFGSGVVDTQTAELAKLPSDPEAWQFNRITPSFSPQSVQIYMNLAVGIAEQVYDGTTSRNAVWDGCTTPTMIDCYLNGFSTRIFRRPLSTTEKDKMKAIFSNAGGGREGFVRVLAYQLMHPAFQVRWELGSNSSEPDNNFTISNYELVSRIAFAVTETTPDAELLAKAADGSISTNSVMRAQVARLMATPAAKLKYRDFAFYWTKTDLQFNFTDLPSTLIGTTQTSGLGDAAIAETRQFMEYMIWNNKTYAELLTSKVSFASHAGLASIYNHAPVSSSSPASFGGNRKGVFGRLPFLFSRTSRTALIPRALKFREQVLCEKIPEPSAEVFAMRDDFRLTDAEAEKLSTRDFVAAITKSEGCMTCHAIINPTGNLFEGYDSLGRDRSEELVFNSAKTVASRVSVDTSDKLPLGAEGVQYAASFGDVVDFLATTEKAQRCFAKKIVSYSIQSDLKTTDSCRVQKVYDTMRRSGSTLLDAVVDSIAQDALRKKRVVL